MASKTQMISSDLFTIPNLLTLLRVILSPYIAFLMINSRYKESLFWIFIAGLTDFLDGFLARKLGQSSSIGAIFDPIADKIFVFVLFTTCIYLKWIPKWFVSVVFTREIVILGGIMFLYHKGVSVSIDPLFSSKLNTAFQFLLLGSMILKLLFPIANMTDIFLIATACTTIYSGLEYISVGLSALNNGRD